ncbi:hypothetical protein BV898_19818 [Hypsibius exemplaris]|uniref:Tc1-like transposase DDE domain-containing protein n=1 Tax=Hypsibius exemplaris TaxID=2072580 RepID=A0A9X6RQ40_HYPEX|nr:hypothetical protein BV898_19818 [Hypsibius exemplaris]
MLTSEQRAAILSHFRVAATIVRRLTVAPTAHTIRSVARQFEISATAICKLLDKKDITCFKKRKRTLLSAGQKETRKKSCRGFRKTFQKEDLAMFLFVDEFYVTDEAPCYAATSVQALQKEEFPRFIPNAQMPPNSPDLNVFDYCVWTLLKHRLTKYGLVSNFDKLKKILKEWAAIPQDCIRAAVDSWQRRVRALSPRPVVVYDDALQCYSNGEISDL